MPQFWNTVNVNDGRHGRFRGGSPKQQPTWGQPGGELLPVVRQEQRQHGSPTVLVLVLVIAPVLILIRIGISISISIHIHILVIA